MGLCGIQKEMKNERGGEMTNIDISPEAVEHLCAIHERYEQHGTVATLRALSAECERLKGINKKLCADFNLMNQLGAKQDAALTQSRAEMAKLLAMNDAGYDTVTYRAVAAADARGMRRAAELALQRKGDGTATLGHPYDKGYLAACDACAAAILALIGEKK